MAKAPWPPTSKPGVEAINDRVWRSTALRILPIIRIIRKVDIETMVKVTSAEFQKNIGHYQDIALTQPVTVTRNGRERTVVISAEEYRRLKKRDREVLGLDDFTQEDVEAIRVAEPPPATAQFDGELE
jgi:prevent-host-death family protein